MKISLCFITGCLLITTSCKKSSEGPNIPSGDPNNEMKATVSIKGGPATSFTATGNNTLFVKRVDPNRDTVLTILGGSIQITLVNTNSAGTYVFENNPNSRQYSLCSYSIGNVLTGPFELYFATTGNQPGTITIDNLTSGSIKGSFTSNCIGTGGVVQITNGSFKGNF